ncbi:MAG: sodium-dependent transporter, partial [Planctomycetota bacterium]
MPEVEPRERWASRGAFIMAAIGSAVGLGNLWRFPYIAYKFGGGAFLIPYFIALLTAGIPLMILEYGIGQMFQGSAPKALGTANKKWRWLGWWALGIGSTIAIYYTVIMAYCWNYLWHSLWISWERPGAQKFFDGFLQKSGGVAEIGGLVLPIVLGLALTWVCVYFIICKGVLRVGKVVMITVPLPVLLLVLIAIKSFTLPGAWEGIKYYITPNFAALMNPQVWLAAYGQVFFSLSIGFGVLIAYASYRSKKAEVNNSAFITSLANCGYSFFAGFAVFSIVGYVAAIQNMDVSKAVDAGFGLAFVVYPTAIATLGSIWGPIVGVAFFITLLSLGIDSAFSLVEGVLTGIHERVRMNRKLLTFLFCLFGFVLGLIFCTHAGFYWIDLVDNWMSNYGLPVVGLLQCIVIGWLYKTRELKNMVNEVSEIKVRGWWTFCVRVLTPLILLVSLGLTLAGEFNNAYGGNPRWATMVGGWCLLGLITAAATLLSGRKKVALVFLIGTVLLGASWWLNDWLADGQEFALFVTLIVGATFLAASIISKNI